MSSDRMEISSADASAYSLSVDHQQSDHPRPPASVKSETGTGIGIDDAIQLSEQLSKLVNQQHMSDVTFVVGENKEEIYGHRVILAARSPVFAAMLYNGLRESREREIVVPNIEPSVFLSMLEYIYGGKTLVTTDNVVALLAACNQYDISSLVQKCTSHIRNSLSVSNVCRILLQTHGYPEIWQLCIEFIETNASAVFASPGFLELPENLVIELVKRDHLSIQEIEVFQAVLNWGKYNCSNYRTKEVGGIITPLASSSAETREDVENLRFVLRNIVQHIRLPLISASDLLRVVKPTEVIPTPLYLSAMEYLAAPNQVEVGNNPFFKRRLGFGPLFSFCWEPAIGFKVIGANSLSAIRTGEDEWRGIFGNHAIQVTGSKQIIRFEIKIKRINADRSGMVIGLAKLRDRYNCCWGYGGSGYSYPSQTRTAIKESEFQKNDIIGVHFDNAKRQVSFYRNGSLLFVNPKVLPLGIEVYPVVYMHYVYDEVAIKC